MSIGTEGAKGGDGEGNVTDTHTGRGGRGRAKVVNSRLAGHAVVVSKTAGVGVEGGEGGGAGRVDGLHVNNDERLTTVKIGEHDIRLLRQARAIPSHPTLHGGVTTCTCALGDDASLAEGGGKDGDEGVTNMVVDGGVEADAMRAGDVVTTIGGMEVGAARASTVCAGRCGNQLRRAEKEIEGESSDIVIRDKEAEAVGDGDALEPRRRALRHRAIKEAAAALGGGGGVKEGEEVSCCEGGSGGLCGAW